MEVKGNQNIFDFTLEKFGTLENLFSDVLVPNSLPVDRETQSNQEVNINAVGKGDDDVKMKISEQGLSITNGDIAAPVIPPVVDLSFKLTINTALGTGDNFQLPLPLGETYDFVVDWGDGNSDAITAYNQTETLHTYASPFNGQISITGVCGGWSFNNLGDKLKVTSVDNLGDVGFVYLRYGFFGCINLVSLPSGGIKMAIGYLSDFSSTFRSTGLTTLPADLLSYVNIVTFLQTFQSTPLVAIPDGFLDNQTNAQTFQNCFALTNISSIPSDLLRYCVNATIMTGIFYQNLILVNIPENLFYYNPLVTLYDFALGNNRNMILPSVIFDLSNINIVTSFNVFMNAISTGFSSTGTIQDIWNYAVGATSVNTLLNQTALTNYASVPNGWKGL